ncbi:MAG: F0F1 ATP synthase subunit alpha, partial [Nocardioidaceae bacterium]
MELLKQTQFNPYPFEEQSVSMHLGLSGKLDAVPVEDVQRLEREFLDYLRHDKDGVLAGIRESRDWDDDTAQAVDSAFEKFSEQFETSEGKSLKAGKEEFEALEDEDVKQEQIIKQKRS